MAEKLELAGEAQRAGPEQTKPSRVASWGAAVVLSLGMAGCATTGENCHPDTETFMISEDVTAVDVRVALLGGYVTSNQIPCQELCRPTYTRVTRWTPEFGPDDACVVTLDEVYTLGELEDLADDEVVGSIACSGTGFEYLCG